MTAFAFDTKYGTAYHIAGAIGMAGSIFVPFLNIILPGMLWAFYGDGSKFSRHHGWQALRFQLMLSFYGVILVATMFVGFGTTFLGGFALTVASDNPAGFFGGMGLSFLLMLGIGVCTVAIFAVGVITPLIAAAKAKTGGYWTYPFVFAREAQTSTA